jgi:hypothetical protein
MQNVKFYFGSSEKFNQLAEKNPLALYFLEDVQQLWKGDKLYATGALATAMADGLMSSDDKAKLDELVVGTSLGLKPVDGSIVIADVDGGKSIGVKVSKEEGNLIEVKSDGLFVKVDSLPLESVVGLKAKLDAIEQAAIGGIHYRGSVATVEDLPVDAVQGDLYEVLKDNSEWCFNGEEWFQYGNTAGLTPVAGAGISIVDSTFSVKIAPESHGLVIVDGAIALALATEDNDGALSKEDKALIDSIPEIYATIEQVTEVTNKIEESYSWDEL